MRPAKRVPRIDQVPTGGIATSVRISGPRKQESARQPLRYSSDSAEESPGSIGQGAR